MLSSIVNIARSQPVSNVVQTAQTVQGLVPAANNNQQLNTEQKRQLLDEIQAQQDLAKKTKRDIAIAALVTLATAGLGITALGSKHRTKLRTQYKQHLPKINNISNFDDIYNARRGHINTSEEREISFVPVKDGSNNIIWLANAGTGYSKSTVYHDEAGQLLQLKDNRLEFIHISDPSGLKQVAPPVYINKTGQTRNVSGAFGLGFNAIGNLRDNKPNLAEKSGVQTKFSSNSRPAGTQGGFFEWLNTLVMFDILSEGAVGLASAFI